MKTIVTHLSPHLDEIFSIWAIKNYDPEWKEFQVKFKATNPSGGEVPLDEVDKDPATIYLGLGRGKYDEHKQGKDEVAAATSAAALVWLDLKGRGLIPDGEVKTRAAEKLLEFIVKDDTGELKGMPDYLVDFTIVALWDGFAKVHRGDSEKKLEYGLPMMEYMVSYLSGIVSAEDALKDAVTFDTPWGKGLATETSIKESQVVAYREGYNVVANIVPKLGYHMVVANPTSPVDLTEVYHKLQGLDSEAEWYLHQSGRMLFSGSHSAPNVKISKLTLEQMIDLLKV